MTPDGQFIFVGLVLVTACACQAMSGIGFSLVASPILIGAFGPESGLRLTLLFGAITNAALMLRDVRSILVRRVLTLLIVAIVATPVWSSLLASVPPGILSRAVGFLAILSSLILAIGWTPDKGHGLTGGIAAGLASSLMNVTGALGGPAVAIYALADGWSLRELHASLNTYFLGLCVWTLSIIGMPSVSRVDLGVGVVSLVGGLIVGLWARGRVSRLTVKRMVYGLAAGAGLVLLAGFGQ